MTEPIFSAIPFVGDPRVTPALENCTHCGERLERQTTDAKDGEYMMLFAHCQRCNRAYILDEMQLPK